MDTTKGDLVRFRSDFSAKLNGLTFRVTSDPSPDNSSPDKGMYVWLSLATDRRKVRSAYVADLIPAPERIYPLGAITKDERS